MPFRGVRIRPALKRASSVPSAARLLAAVCLSMSTSLNCALGSAQAPAHGSASAESHVGKGYEYIKDERFRAAAQEFEAAIAIDPRLERARYQLAICYFALGQRDDARREFERLRIETHNSAEVAYYLGRLDLIEHQPESAVRELASIALHPRFPDTAYYLGAAYLEKGDLALAKRWLQRAEGLAPRDFRVPDHLARVDQRLGLSAEAEKEYARSAELRQSYDQAATIAVACSRDLETRPADEAHANCRKLFQPDDPDKLATLGLIYGQHHDYEPALEPLERAAELDPASWEIEHDLGLTYFRLKHYSEARGPLERAVAMRPDFFGSNAALGATLFMLKDDDAAYSVLAHAHQLNPQDSDTAELLFRTSMALAARAYEAKNYRHALEYTRTAATLKPSDPQVRARLGELHKLLGE